jgi:hypothetical protein
MKFNIEGGGGEGEEDGCVLHCYLRILVWRERVSMDGTSVT